MPRIPLLLFCSAILVYCGCSASKQHPSESLTSQPLIDGHIVDLKSEQTAPQREDEIGNAHGAGNPVGEYSKFDEFMSNIENKYPANKGTPLNSQKNEVSKTSKRFDEQSESNNPNDFLEFLSSQFKRFDTKAKRDDPAFEDFLNMLNKKSNDPNMNNIIGNHIKKRYIKKYEDFLIKGNKRSKDFEDFLTSGNKRSKDFEDFFTSGNKRSKDFQDFLTSGNKRSKDFENFFTSGIKRSNDFQDFVTNGNKRITDFDNYISSNKKRSKSFEDFFTKGNKRSLSVDDFLREGNKRSKDFEDFLTSGNKRSKDFESFFTSGNKRSKDFQDFMAAYNKRSKNFEDFFTSGNKRSKDFKDFFTSGNKRSRDFEDFFTSGNKRSKNFEDFFTTGSKRSKDNVINSAEKIHTPSKYFNNKHNPRTSIEKDVHEFIDNDGNEAGKQELHESSDGVSESHQRRRRSLKDAWFSPLIHTSRLKKIMYRTPGIYQRSLMKRPTFEEFLVGGVRK